MSELAEEALRKLLKRAENAAAKPETLRSVTLRFSTSSFPGYFESKVTHEDRQRCHAHLELAEREGAILISWDRRAGLRKQVDSLRLVSGDTLARFLYLSPRWDLVSAAERALAPSLAAHPLLRELYPIWRAGRKVIGTSVADVSRWLDAVKLVDHCRRSARQSDVGVRRLSTQLFGDSKKVESLLGLADLLLQGVLDPAQRDEDDVLHELGLVKHPPTMLIAGSLKIGLASGREVSVSEPYLGIPPTSVTSVSFEPKCGSLLTIENLQTFHEAAQHAAARRDWVILYTGGMPPPSWRQVYAKCLEALPENGHVWHWGDIDAGGFRIAEFLARCCDATGRTLKLHNMAVPRELLFADGVLPRSLKPNELNAIARVCDARGWADEVRAVLDRPLAIEQEMLEIRFPEDEPKAAGQADAS